jgi:hypothetical protein
MNVFEAGERIVDELGGPIMFILECGNRNNITVPKQRQASNDGRQYPRND